jgi:hypothetical protein
MIESRTITGTVIGLREEGILVIVYLDVEDGRTLPVVLDRRLFRRCLDDENGGPSLVIGRRVRYEGRNLSLER